MPGESHKLDSVAMDGRSLGAAQTKYDRAVHPKPGQGSPKPKGTGNERVGRLIIGKPHESTVGGVKEQIIKLDPKAGERGKGPGSQPGAGQTIGRGFKPGRGGGGGITSGMGGRR